MASSNDDFPIIASDTEDNLLHRQQPPKRPSSAVNDAGNSAFYSQNTDIIPFPSSAGDSPDPNKSNGKRTPHSSKKRHVATDSPGGSECRKDREEWSDSAIGVLLEVYTEKYMQLNRGNLRGRDWEEVAVVVSERGDKVNSSKSVEQCKNKVDNLKKRYKVELQRVVNGGLTTSSWHWFKKIEAIIGNAAGNVKGASDDDRSAGGNSSYMLRQPKRYASNSPALGSNLKSKPVPTPKWRRVVFRISGTALTGSGQSVDPKMVLQIAKEVSTACRLGVEVAIVVGGRNFFCGDSWVSDTGLDRPTAYQIGMMATVMNSVLLQSALEKLGVQTRLQSAFSMPEVAEPYSRQRAIRHLEKGRVVIFGGVGAGTGNPLFSTDTAAALRASEINADALLKGSNVNGIYGCHSGDSNPIVDHMSFRDVISRGVTGMDMMAIQYCEENGVSVVLFNLLEPGNISRALCGEQVGTLVDQNATVS